MFDPIILTLASIEKKQTFEDNPTCWKNFIGFIKDQESLFRFDNMDKGELIRYFLSFEYDADIIQYRYDNYSKIEPHPTYIKFYNPNGYLLFMLRFS
jgi:hypothetical protein